jgi:hypothetical protein
MASSAEVGFAINVDGVLTHKSRPLPFAKEVLSFLKYHDYPFVLFGDGTRAQTEKELSLELQCMTGIQIPAQNFVFPYSPFQTLLKHIPGFATQHILVVGGPLSRIKTIAESYGFQRVFTTLNLQQYPQTLRIDAILVFNTPDNWDADLKTVVGLLTSRAGYVDTSSALNGLEELPNRGYCQDFQPSIHWADIRLSHNPGDMTFKQAVEEAWTKNTRGAELLGSWTEPMLPYVEEQLFKNVQTTRLRSAYLIGGTSAKNPLDKLGESGSRFSVDCKSILVITALKRRMYKQPVVPVPNVGVGMAWAFDDAGLQEAAEKILYITGFEVQPSRHSFNETIKDTDSHRLRALQPDMPSPRTKKPLPSASSSHSRRDLNKPLPYPPHEEVRAEIQKSWTGQLRYIIDSSESSSHQSTSSPATSFKPETNQLQPPSIPHRSPPPRPSRPDDELWASGNVEYCHDIAAQVTKAQAWPENQNVGGQALDKYLRELVRGRESPSMEDSGKSVSTDLEQTEHGRYLARMRRLQDSSLAAREYTRQKLEWTTNTSQPVRTSKKHM